MMAFDKEQIRSLVYRTLKEYNLYSLAAVELVLGTMAQESRMGYYLRQVPVGTFKMEIHGLGCTQVEMNTFNTLQTKFGVEYGFADRKFEELEYDLKFAILICRLRYYLSPEPLPGLKVEALANYWRRIYNTRPNLELETEFKSNYRRYAI